MNVIRLLFILVLTTPIFSYSQKSNCDNNNQFKAKVLTLKLGNKQTKNLKESFEVFEELLKTKNIELFLKKADKDFNIFGRPKNEMASVLSRIGYRKVCIDTIKVDNKNSVSIFFTDVENSSQMILKFNEKFQYLSWEILKVMEQKRSYLEGDVLKIPLIIIGDYPFIDGEINGVKGRWMFDTGNSKAFSLHSKKVVGIESEVVGSGFVASGQKYEVLEYPLIDQIKVGDNVHNSVKKVKGNNFDFLEQITPTVLGQIGFDYFKGYDMKLDYLRSELTFYKQKNTVETWNDIKSHKNYITSLPYFTRRLDNHPMIKLQYKGIDFLVTFDTAGGKGSFTVEDSHFEKLKNDGDFEYFYDEPSNYYNWYNIKIDECLTINLFGMEKEDFSPAHKPLQITEKNTFTLDHSFLSEYITIWDTKNKVIHVLEKK